LGILQNGPRGERRGHLGLLLARAVTGGDLVTGEPDDGMERFE
jgi:hypothetical protein